MFQPSHNLWTRTCHLSLHFCILNVRRDKHSLPSAKVLWQEGRFHLSTHEMCFPGRRQSPGEDTARALLQHVLRPTQAASLLIAVHPAPCDVTMLWQLLLKAPCSQIPDKVVAGLS